MEYMCFNQAGDISTLNGSSLRLVDKFTYLGSSVSSTEKDINMSFWSHVEEWTARTCPKQLVLLDVGYVIDNVVPPYKGEKSVVFLAILAVARMVIWVTQN